MRNLNWKMQSGRLRNDARLNPTNEWMETYQSVLFWSEILKVTLFVSGDSISSLVGPGVGAIWVDFGSLSEDWHDFATSKFVGSDDGEEGESQNLQRMCIPISYLVH